MVFNNLYWFTNIFQCGMTTFIYYTHSLTNTFSFTFSSFFYASSLFFTFLFLLFFPFFSFVYTFFPKCMLWCSMPIQVEEKTKWEDLIITIIQFSRIKALTRANKQDQFYATIFSLLSFILTFVNLWFGIYWHTCAK